MRKEKHLLGKVLLAAFVCVAVLFSVIACNPEGGNETTDECETHSYGTWTVVSEPSCTDYGSEKRTCSVCGHVETRKIDILDHDFEDGPVTGLVCGVSDGKIKRVCKECGAEDTVVVPKAKAHSFTFSGGKPATCTEEGRTERKECKTCGFVEESKAIAPLGHELAHTAERKATCTEKGNIEYWYCAVCKKYFSDEKCEHEVASTALAVDAKGHSAQFVEAVEKDTPCHPDNVKAHYHCSACGLDFEDEACRVKMNDVSGATEDHVLVKHDTTISCQAAGYKDYWECTVCGCLFAAEDGKEAVTLDSLVTPIADHEYVLFEEKAPYCGVDEGKGWIKHYECKYCHQCILDLAEKEVVPSESVLLGASHTYKGIPAEAATCEKDGVLAHYICTVCEKLFDLDKNEVEAKDIRGDEKIAHTPYRVVRTGACACDYYLCTACGRTFSDDECKNEQNDFSVNHQTALLAHKDAVEPTCMSVGQKAVWHCASCRTYFFDEQGLVPAMYEDTPITDDTVGTYDAFAVLAKTEHAWQYVPAIAPTCTEDGKKDYYQCASCGQFHFSDEPTVLYSGMEIEERCLVAKTGHDFRPVAKIDATCTETGYAAGSRCSVCDEWEEERAVLPLIPHSYDANGVCTECEHKLAYEIAFDAADKITGTYSVVYGEDFTLPVPTDGKGTFIGWSVLDGETEILITNGSGKGILPWSVIRAYTLNAETKENLSSYVMTWTEEGAVATAINALTAGTGTFAQVVQAKLDTASVVYLDETAVAVKAVWTESPIEIYYNLDKTPKDMETPVVTNPTKVAADTRFTLAGLVADNPGYSFGGWYSGNTGMTKINGLISRVTLSATWIANEFNVSFVSAQGDPIGDIPVKYNEKQVLPTPSVTKKVFLGWFFDKEFKTPCEKEIVMPAKDVTLYAKWDNFAINKETFVYNGATAIRLADVNEEGKIVSEDFVRIFEPSVKDALGRDIAEECTFTAILTGSIAAKENVAAEVIISGNGISVTCDIGELSLYGVPTLTRSGENTLDYFSFGDELVADKWGYADVKDSFDEALDIEIFVGSRNAETGLYEEAEYEGGDKVTVVVRVTDVAGNVAVNTIADVKVYTAPTITVANDVKAVKVSEVGTLWEINDDDVDFEKLLIKLGAACSDLFDASSIAVSCAFAEGSADPTKGEIKEGDKIIVTLSAQAEHGDKGTKTVEIKVLGTPRYVGADNLSFNVGDAVSTESVGFHIEDSCGDEIEATDFALKQGETVVAGKTSVYIVKAKDAANNELAHEVYVRFYSEPVLKVYDETASGALVESGEFKAVSLGTDLTKAAELGVVAKDSFGMVLQANAEIVKWSRKVGEEYKEFTPEEDGEYVKQAGDIVWFRFTASDRLFNEAQKEQKYKIYSADSIIIAAADIPDGNRRMKIGSHGEEFKFTAIDSFGQACEISACKIENGVAKDLVAGETASVLFRATDVAGNVKDFDTVIDDVQIYDLPTVTYKKHNNGVYLIEGETTTQLFDVRDSFGNIVDTESCVVTDASGAELGQLAVNGLAKAKKAVVTTKEDNVGGFVVKTFFIPVLGEGQSIIELAFGGEVLAKYLVTNGVEYDGILTEIAGYALKGWKLGETTYDADNTGKITFKESTDTSCGVYVFEAVTEAALVTVKCGEVTYKVTFGEKTIKNGDGQVVGSLPIPQTDENEKFVGWKLNDEFVTDENGVLLEKWTLTGSEQYTLSAATVDVYTLKYKIGTEEKTIKVAEGEDFFIQPASQTGKVFIGWEWNGIVLTGSDGYSLNPWSAEGAAQSEITLTDSYSLVVTILHVYYGEELFETKAVSYGYNFTLTVPEKGYNFGGWYASVNNVPTQMTDLDGASLLPWTIAESEYRLFALNPYLATYTIEYDEESLCGVELPETAPASYDAKTVGGLTLPVLNKTVEPEVTKELLYTGANAGKFLVTTVTTEYTFGGWYVDEGRTQSIGTITIDSENLYLYAKWTVNQRTNEEYVAYLLDEDEKGMYMGAYPQTKVDDAAVLARLNEAKDPNTKLEQWTSYRYYTAGVQSDIMYYVDYFDEVSGEMYRGVYINTNRPKRTTSGTDTYQKANGYDAGVYWFRYEWIHWTILGGDEDTYTVIADRIIDAQDYKHIDLDALCETAFVTASSKGLLSAAEANGVEVKVGTDYALSQNLYSENGKGSWWLGTADATVNASFVSYQGTIGSDAVDKTYYGLVPVLVIEK